MSLRFQTQIAHVVLASFAWTAMLEQARSDESVVLPRCEVSIIKEVQVPGREPGVLEALEAREGMRVTKGMEVGSIDKLEALAQLEVKQLEAEAAKAEAESPIEINYAITAANHAKASWQVGIEANRQV